MNCNKLHLAGTLLVSAMLWAPHASATLYVDLQRVSGLHPAATLSPAGGGLSQFTIAGFSGTGPAQVIGTQGDTLFAMCIESGETIYDTSRRWYEFAPLEGAPTSGTITADEVGIIERLLTGEFGLDFVDKTTGTVDQQDISALQALFWEAAISDITSEAVAGWGASSTATAAQALANAWLGTYRNTTLPNSVDAYALLRVADDKSPAKGQDFLFYRPGSDTSTSVPVPAPLALIGLGLLGLFGFSRRRA